MVRVGSSIAAAEKQLILATMDSLLGDKRKGVEGARDQPQGAIGECDGSIAEEELPVIPEVEAQSGNEG